MFLVGVEVTFPNRDFELSNGCFEGGTLLYAIQTCIRLKNTIFNTFKMKKKKKMYADKLKTSNF